MLSRFPGIDPYVEGSDWKDFHGEFIAVLRESLVARLRPRYIVKTEESVYVADEDTILGIRLPDVSLSRDDDAPVPSQMRQLSLQIVRAADRELVTVIELLSPWNKTGNGRDEYLAKRIEILSSRVSLVELDLLRAGKRLPVRGRLPAGDFYALVSRGKSRPKVEVFPWTLRPPLPTIPIPLAPDDDELPIDLQRLFTTTYDRAGYDYALNYKTEIVPPLTDADKSWAAQILSSNADA